MEGDTILGIDVGGTAIKGALVDVRQGQLLTERIRIETPQPSNPRNMASVVREIAAHFQWKDQLIGCGFPAIVKHGVALSAANIDPSWIGSHVEKTFGEATQCEVHAINDADCAGLAVMQYGIGKGRMGTVVLITIGTGLGSAVFCDGRLLPNTELGHLYTKSGKLAEKYASFSARKRGELTMEGWALRFNKLLQHFERVLSPDLFILGGGGSNRYAEFEQYLKLETEVVPAGLRNKAGIIGAAYYAAQMHRQLEF